MSESQPNQPINFSSFADWCKHKDSLSESARHTVEVLLEQAGQSACNEADLVLSNLTELYLEDHQITDITPLSGLTNLTYLNLEDNQITEITGLSRLTNLTVLYLGSNQITDITGLWELTNLTKLSLNRNQITDITGLSGLTNLTKLYISDNQITDITGLSSLTNVTKLSIGNNPIIDITSLSPLTNLTDLDLYMNQITDITALSGFTNLTKLSISSNQISDIAGLSGLTNLTSLNLNDNQITDITGLSGLTNLTRLDLDNNQITDITGLSVLTNLTELSIADNQITDITKLSALTNLLSLYLYDNQIIDITPLSGLINLTELFLNSNQITDMAPLSALTNLTQLILPYNQITDITPLLGLTNLTELYLSGNQISDITPVSGLTNLTELLIDNNQITDITPLLGLTNLTRLELRDNPITYLNWSSEFTQKYLTLFTAPIHYEKATETVKKIYAAIDIEPPKVLVCSSLPATLTLLKQLQNDCIAQHQISPIATGNSGWGQSLLNELYQSVDVGTLSPVLWDALFYEIILEPDADRILVSQFEELVENFLESLRVDSLSDYNYLQPLTPMDLFKEIHLTELFISKFGITLDLKAQELLRCKQQLFEECGWILPFEKICIICDRPLHIRFDAENRLHAEGEPAIAFADGYSLYFHHGVKLPEEYGKVHPDRWQAEWLLSEENAELRRVLIERIGYDRICQELEVTELDSWQEYTLLSIEFDDDFDDEGNAKPVYLLKMTCPSTGHIHALRVPPDMRSAQEAIRWVNWDIDPAEFSVQT